MTLPFISAICITYARPELLCETLQSFLNQQYAGRKELIVFNTFPQQELIFDHPEVKIINSSIRPPTIGETRNAAIAHASGELLVTFDDDDKYLPNHFQNCARGFNPVTDGWTWLSHQFYMEGHSLKSITQGTPNVLSYTRSAFDAVGGFISRNVGEDQSLVARITQRFQGRKVELSKEEISFIYQWGQGAYHISGQGEAGNGTVMERAQEFALRQLGEGRIKAGRIELQPKWNKDYKRMADDFTGAVRRINDSKIGKVGLVELGRYGDILNILPVAKAMGERLGKPVHFFVSRLFADILDGVSYVIPEVLDVPYDAINEAVRIAQQKCQLVINSQVWGMNYTTSREHPVYNVESWRMAGFLKHFGDTKGFPLVIDQRDAEREQKLVESLPIVGNPVVLVNIGGGHTAPYSGAAMFFNSLRESWDHKFNVLDISQVRASRIYDLLGLFDRAQVMVTNDTATVHLAAAHSIPVIFLSNNNPWLSSLTRCNVVLRLNYDDALRRMSEVNGVLGKL